MTKNLFLSISMFIIGAACLTGCPNYVPPDEHGRLCDPGSFMDGSEGCLTGCDHDSNGQICDASGRDWECRLIDGRVCTTTPECPAGNADCTSGVGACMRHGITSCPPGSTSATLCSSVAGSAVAEVCGNAIDDDCDGSTDEDCPVCHDFGVESCNNLNDDCDDAIDEGCDDDNDDYCDASMHMGPSGSLACPRTSPGPTSGDDCDDTNSARHPGCTEICNMIDDNCNGLVDEGGVCVTTCTTVWYAESDRDGYPRHDATATACTAPSGYVSPRTDGQWDCNDANASVHPGATEICNSIDDDCDGLIDEGGVCTPTCTPVTEVCDGVDNDCDGFRDEGGVCAVCEDNLGGTLRVRPSASLLATCSRGLVTIAWGPGGTELRSVAGATSYSIIMTSSWRGWVRLQAFCPDDPSRGSEIGNWAGTTRDWNPIVGSTLRSAGYTVDIDGMDLSDMGYVCRESSSSSLSKPHVPLDMCSTFACPR